LLGSERQLAHLRSAIRQPVGALICDTSPFDLRQQWRVPRLLRGAALYHSPYYLMPYFPGRPTVITFHDAIPLRFPAYVSARARLFFWLTLQLALRSADHVITVSRSAQHDLRAAAPSLQSADVTTIFMKQPTLASHLRAQQQSRACATAMPCPQISSSTSAATSRIRTCRCWCRPMRACRQIRHRS
jgi:hypothetical protein